MSTRKIFSDPENNSKNMRQQEWTLAIRRAGWSSNTHFCKSTGRKLGGFREYTAGRRISEDFDLIEKDIAMGCIKYEKKKRTLQIRKC